MLCAAYTLSLGGLGIDHGIGTDSLAEKDASHSLRWTSPISPTSWRGYSLSWLKTTRTTETTWTILAVPVVQTVQAV